MDSNSTGLLLVHCLWEIVTVRLEIISKGFIFEVTEELDKIECLKMTLNFKQTSRVRRQISVNPNFEKMR